MPKLSIITINYNNLDGLKRTVESVVNQTSRDFERYTDLFAQILKESK